MWIFSTLPKQNLVRFGLAVISLGNVFTTPISSAFAQEPGTKLWEFKVDGSSPAVYAAPAIGADGTIYVTASTGLSFAPRGFLYALNPNGTRKWAHELALQSDAELFSSPSVGADGTIYFSAEDKLIAVAPDGTRKWGVQISTPFDTSWIRGSGASPTTGQDGSIYVGSPNGKFYAFTPDGKIKWTYAPFPPYPFQSAPLVAQDGTVYAASRGPSIYALRPDGSEKWKMHDVGGGATALTGAIDYDGTIYVTITSGVVPGKLSALNPIGFKKWEFSTSHNADEISAPVIADDGSIYFTTIEWSHNFSNWRNRLYAVNRDGTKKLEQEFGQVSLISSFWRRSLKLPMLLAPTIGADRVVYFGAADGKMRAVSPGTARTIWLFAANSALESIAAISPPALSADGILYFGTGDGKVYALKASTGPANSPWPMYGRDLRRSGSVRRFGSDFGFQSFDRMSDGATAFTLLGHAGRTYTLQASIDFVNWAKVQEVATANGAVVFHDSGSANASHRFYRAVSP